MAFSLLVFPLAVGCGGDAGEPGGTAEQEFEGVSPQELELNAEPMTLEEAESLGIVDTTIVPGSPIGPDSIPVLNDAQPPDPAAP